MDLLETIEDGINHINIQLSELRFEEAFIMLQDITEGILSIEDAIKPVMNMLNFKDVENLANDMKHNLSKAIGSYKKGKEEELAQQVGIEIMSSFKRWKNGLEVILKPYALS